MHLFVYKRDTELLPARFRSVCAPTYHMHTHTHTHSEASDLLQGQVVTDV